VCGLIGFVSAGEDAASSVTAIEVSLSQMRHRGPDEGGVWSDRDVCIGFRRLSIIDIDRSHQPLPYLGRYHLIFNGEVYNYLELRDRLARDFGATFETDGDGEAIVAGYHYLGEKIVRELRGMFSFLIWDAQERILFGARDWFGIKPLYSYLDERGAFFASEKKSLLAIAGPTVADDINHTALQQYLTLQYVPEPESLHSRIRRIESGTYFTLRPGGQPETRRYFRPDFGIRSVPEPEKLYREITEVLEDSVAKHMRADVTVGSFLSGGIDSTAIAALAKRHNPKLLTFTTGFEREGYSEIDVAAESAAAIGVEHITKVVTPQEMMDTLPLIVWYLDDPVADAALVPLYFIAREARKHVKVVLSGEGADELFGGYQIYREAIALRAFDYIPPVVRRRLGAVSERLPAGMRGKDLLRRGSIGIEERYYGNARIFRPDEMIEVVRQFDPATSYLDVTRPLYAATEHLDGPTRMQYVDLFTWLRGDILVKAGQDDDGQLARAARAVPRHRGLPGGVVGSDGPQADQGHDEVRAATSIGRHRAAARAQPGQARLSGADQVLAQGCDVRLGARHHHRVASGRPDRSRNGTPPARRAPDRPARLLAQDLDASRAVALARHLRREAHPAEHSRAGLPRSPLVQNHDPDAPRT
jgi:asparagine synthase (glutamine-hydrolysing)